MCVGGMGHTISIASGLALSKPKKKIFCFDGDGSFLMHLGASTTSAKLKNIIHIVFNNRSHDSVGGQVTSAPHLNLRDIAVKLGYDICMVAKNEKEIYLKLFQIQNFSEKVRLLEILDFLIV